MIRADIGAFSVPQCGHCGGMLKPDVVFFGEGIPRTRVDAARAALEEADAMLVVGSSLMVYSGYRLCEHAHGIGKPIAAINRGRTRADHLFTLKVERRMRRGAYRPGRDARCSAFAGLRRSPDGRQRCGACPQRLASA